MASTRCAAVSPAEAAIAAVLTELGYHAQPAPQPTDIDRLIVRAST